MKILSNFLKLIPLSLTQDFLETSTLESTQKEEIVTLISADLHNSISVIGHLEYEDKLKMSTFLIFHLLKSMTLKWSYFYQ